jgi:hypothetical protein
MENFVEKVYMITAVAPPPIVKKAETSNRIPIDKYKSKSIANLMNKAPLNKSAFFFFYFQFQNFWLKIATKITEIFVNMYKINERADRYIWILFPPNRFLMYSGIVVTFFK